MTMTMLSLHWITKVGIFGNAHKVFAIGQGNTIVTTFGQNGSELMCFSLSTEFRAQICSLPLSLLTGIFTRSHSTPTSFSFNGADD
jgi:hypothetical protein